MTGFRHQIFQIFWIFHHLIIRGCQSRWSRDRRFGSAAACLLGLRF